MDLENLDKEMNSILSRLASTPEDSEEYKKLMSCLRSLQEMEVKERETRLKEAELDVKRSCEQSKAESETTKQMTYAREIDVRAEDLKARIANDRRQAVLAYSKIVIGTVGTIGSILLVAACEEERVLRSKGFGYVKNFAMRFL